MFSVSNSHLTGYSLTLAALRRELPARQPLHWSSVLVAALLSEKSLSLRISQHL